MIKKVLVALAISVFPVTGALAQTTASSVVPGNYQIAPQTNCTVGPCFVPFSDTNPLPVTSSSSSSPAPQQIGITPTNRTITSATGASQQLMAANSSRHSLLVQNTGSSNCGVNPTGGTAVIGGAGTLTLFPGGSYSPRVPSLSAVTVICTAGQPIYANEN